MSRLVIEAGKTERGYWADLWRFRELFFFLSWRDILVRYKQTVIGILWAVIRPLLTKIYFPRLIIPASSVIVSFFDFLISLVILAGVMAWFHVVPDWHVVLLPVFALLGFFASFGTSLWLAALNVKYRDFRYVIPFVVQIGQYVTPVGYAAEMIQKKFNPTVSWIYSLNPMVGVINGFRWTIGGNKNVTLDWSSVAISLAVVAVVSVSGLWYFRRTEQNFADII
jgi:lipopolysaccharide transport system permease protein